MWDDVKVSVREIRLALSAENMYYASLALGKEPTPLEAIQHLLKYVRPYSVHAFEVSDEVPHGGS